MRQLTMFQYHGSEPPPDLNTWILFLIFFFCHSLSMFSFTVFTGIGMLQLIAVKAQVGCANEFVFV